MDRKTAIVTGASSGIGLETAKQLAAEGYVVFGLSRHEGSAEEIRYICCDVTDEKAVERAVAKVIEENGRLDAVVNCAGFGISGAIEFTSTEEAKRLFDVNFFGMVNVNRACIPHLRKTKGRIVNISSVAAPAAIPFQAYYSASKSAINSYSMALANELRPWGISVVAVMPGDTCTGFTDAREKSIEGDDLYGGRIGRSVGKMENDERHGMSAVKAAEAVCRAVTSRSERPLRTIGLQYKLIVLLLKLLPAAWSNRLIGLIYSG